MADSLAQRLACFTEAGLIAAIPTRYQILQGTVEMTPYVVSTDATAERHYKGARFGHSLVRQPLIFSKVGFDHLRTGPAMAARHESICKHLHFTYHEGMPVFDLQVVQTHPNGLRRLRERTEELLANETDSARRHNRFVAMILPNAHDYYAQFLGDEGWIARAERLDYPAPDSEGSAFPPEFFSLVAFLNYCARTFPAQRSDLPWYLRPGHIARLAGRRYREGGRMGWFSRPG
jgi:hypothetical protein